MKISAILFDVVGTTVLERDPDFINRCFEQAFMSKDIFLNRDQISQVRGKDKFQAIQELVTTANASAALVPEIFDEFITRITRGISNFQEHPELETVIKFLQSRNLAIGIGSGLPQSVFRILVKHLRWHRHGFQYTQVFEALNVGRPSPAMIFEMCSKISIEPKQLLKVGDTVSDINEGKNANAKTCVILAGTQANKVLLDAQPDFALKSLGDLISILSD